MDEPRYRDAEARLWVWAGIDPTEHRVELERIGTTVRVQEVGDADGPAVLFVHGGPNSGSTWAPLVAHLDRFRCLLLDRPGTGLSDPAPGPIGIDAANALGDALVGDIVDALGLASTHVVASSLGGFLALRSAAAEPDNVDRMVQMSCPGLVPGMLAPPFMRAIGTPVIGRIVRALPPSRRASVMIMRQIGHGASLDTGRIAPEFLDWYLALQRHTDTLATDQALMAEVVGPRGLDQRVTLPEELIARVKAPTLLYWGADDTFGGEDVGRRLASLLPDATLEVVPDAGHLPWLDDPARAAASVTRFLRGR